MYMCCCVAMLSIATHITTVMLGCCQDLMTFSVENDSLS